MPQINVGLLKKNKLSSNSDKFSTISMHRLPFTIFRHHLQFQFISVAGSRPMMLMVSVTVVTTILGWPATAELAYFVTIMVINH